MLRRLPKDHFHCVLTSPPYYFLRTNGHPGEIGLEESPDEYVAALVGVFRQVRRVLLYLAAIEDMATREIVGWSMADHLKAGLCIDALVMALQRHPPPRGLVHHGDRGVQGGFKWSSQHRGGGWCDGGEKAFGSGAAG